MDKIKNNEPDVIEILKGYCAEMRTTDTYRDFEHQMIRVVKDWRVEYYKLFCQYHNGERGNLIIGQFLMWWTLFTDPKYNTRKKHELYLDFCDYVEQNGVRLDVVRCCEWHSRFVEYINRYNTESTETIKRNTTLMTLFSNNDNTEVYDSFIERCQNKNSADIANEIVGAIKAINDTNIDDYLRKKGVKYTDIHTACQTLGLSIAGYDSFKDALKRRNNATNRLLKRIEQIKQEYKKRSQKL